MSIMMYKVHWTFKSEDETLMCNHSKKATEQFIDVVKFILLH